MHQVVVQSKNLLSSDRWNVEYFIIDDTWVANANANNFTRIGDVAKELKRTIAPNERPESQCTYIGLENIEANTGRFVGNLFCQGADILSRAKIAAKNAVLYGRLRPTLNKVALVPCDANEWVCSTEFIVLEADLKKIHPRFLRELLASEYVTTQVTRFVTGASLPRLPSENLLSMKVPIPEMSVQMEVVERLLDLDREREAVHTRLNAFPSDYWLAISKAVELKV